MVNILGPANYSSEAGRNQVKRVQVWIIKDPGRNPAKQQRRTVKGVPVSGFHNSRRTFRLSRHSTATVFRS